MRTALAGALGLLVILGTAAVAPVQATHGPVVPVMEVAAQNQFDGIRPGQWMEGPHSCTLAFVVEDSQDRKYVTTAGHCVDHVGQDVTLYQDGVIGQVLAFRDDGYGEDFALIEIDPAKYDAVDPRMAGWGGPTGVLTDAPDDPFVVKHYGWGAATWADHETRCRQATSDASLWWKDSLYTQYGVVLWGDSGSPSMTADGKALGINTHLDFVTGTSAGTLFSYALNELESMTGLQLSLVDGGSTLDVCDGST